MIIAVNDLVQGRYNVSDRAQGVMALGVSAGCLQLLHAGVLPATFLGQGMVNGILELFHLPAP